MAEVGLTQNLEDQDINFKIYFSSMTKFKTDCKANSITNSRIDFKTDEHHQVILSN
jgi:hypothetical protein